MTIKKFLGKTEEEAKEKAKTELGNEAVIMNVRVIKPKGLFGLFKSASYEVTAAIEEKNQGVVSAKALMPQHLGHENINMTADEPIKIPVQGESTEEQAIKIAETVKKIRPMLPEETVVKATDVYASKSATAVKETPAKQDDNGIEKRLENLQNILEKSLPKDDDKVLSKDDEKNKKGRESFAIVKMIYEIMLENEVHEKYANQILDEIENIMRGSTSMDFILANVYQKMILKFGQSSTINLEGKKPKVVFFIGPTGVGKTTTIAKVASKLKVDNGKKVAFLTADTYRIAAAEQLRTYANILDTPLTIIYSVDELNEAVSRVKDYDVVLVDTAGFSHKQENQRKDIKNLIQNVNPVYDTDVYLVLSATTKYKDLLEIADSYKEIAEYKMIFTKLDETSCYGNLLNLRLYTGAEIAYTTNGQNVPDDIDEFDSQSIVKQLLGGK